MTPWPADLKDCPCLIFCRSLTSLDLPDSLRWLSKSNSGHDLVPVPMLQALRLLLKHLPLADAQALEEKYH